ncbi:MAG: hypothetical protein AB7E55_12410 [Pigmentiphaga sp.]
MGNSKPDVAWVMAQHAIFAHSALAYQLAEMSKKFFMDFGAAAGRQLTLVR